MSDFVNYAFSFSNIFRAIEIDSTLLAIIYIYGRVNSMRSYSLYFAYRYLRHCPIDGREKWKKKKKNIWAFWV